MEENDQECWRLVAAARDHERLFHVRSNKYCDFYAGHLPNGMQVLIGRTAAERILLLSFGKWGALYDVQRRKLPAFSEPPEEQHLDVNNLEFHQHLRREFGFKTGLV